MTAIHLNQQRGATLIVSLLVLTVLTLLGLSAMNNANLQERMSSHLRDAQLAFESADAALRDSEQWLDTQTDAPLPCLGVTTGCRVFSVEALNALDGADGNPWWAEGDETWWQLHGHDFSADGQDIPQTAADPRSVIEELERVPDSLVIGVAPQGSRIYYRVTSRGVGGSPWAETVVQSTFVKQAN